MAQEVGIKPGKERWSVKTGTDVSAGDVDLEAEVAGIEGLVAMPAPKDPDALLDRDSPIELTTFKVEATLIAYKEEEDGDYHLVLSDGGHTMIAEIPDPDFCEGSKWLEQITAARQAFAEHFDKELSHLKLLTASVDGVAMITKVSVPVTVEGVGFFDRLHGQTGVAPNGIELHPVLSISFGEVS